MKHYITHLTALFLVGVSLCITSACSNDNDVVRPSDDDVIAEYVFTGDASAITQRSATLTCTVNELWKSSNKQRCTYGIAIISADSAKVKDSGRRVKATTAMSGNKFTVAVTDLNPANTYYYCAYVQQPDSIYYFSSSIKRFTTLSRENMPKGAVELGLSVCWAECNLGASTPEAYGDYYGWGCTEPYKYDENVIPSLYFQYIGGTGTTMNDCGTDKDPLRDYATTPNKSIAGTEWDAARKKMGSSWRMPTKEEIAELCNNCTFQWTTKNKVKGVLLTSKANGNTIFLPAAGFRYETTISGSGTFCAYWSNTISNQPSKAPYIFLSNSLQNWNFEDRSHGFTIRPVTE